MNDDSLALKVFNRLNDYLRKHNTYDTFKIENGIIYFYSYHFNSWFRWYDNIDPPLDKACEWFLLGSPEPEKTQTIETYVSVFRIYSNSKNPIVKQICNYIGKPECLEEIIIKMDLMGI